MVLLVCGWPNKVTAVFDAKSLNVRAFKAWMTKMRKEGKFTPEIEQQAEMCLLELKTFKLNRREVYPVEIKGAMRNFVKLERMLKAKSAVS